MESRRTRAGGPPGPRCFAPETKHLEAAEPVGFHPRLALLNAGVSLAQGALLKSCRQVELEALERLLRVSPENSDCNQQPAQTLGLGDFETLTASTPPLNETDGLKKAAAELGCRPDLSKAAEAQGLRPPPPREKAWLAGHTHPVEPAG